METCDAVILPFTHLAYCKTTTDVSQWGRVKGGGGGGNIVYLWNIKCVILGRPEMTYVRAKIYLAGRLDPKISLSPA